MEPDMSDKRIPLEDMSKEGVIQKYNNLLIIAKKAKQSKNETIEELKKAKLKETKFLNEIATLKEMIESFTERQKQFAEIENRSKESHEKISELKNSLETVKGNFALKVNECRELEETLLKQSQQFSDLKKKYADSSKNLDDLMESNVKINIENEVLNEKLLNYQNAENKGDNLQEKFVEEENVKFAELNLYKKSALESVDKLRECEKFSEILFNEESNYFQPMQQINELKKANMEFEILNIKHNATEVGNVVHNEKVDEFNGNCIEELKHDNKNFEKLEKHERKLEAQIEQQKYEFDNNIKFYEEKILFLKNDCENLRNQLRKLDVEPQKILENENYKRVVKENENLVQQISELENKNEENNHLREEIKNIRHNYDESVNLVNRKLEKLLQSFGKITNIRNNFDKEVKSKLKVFQLEQTQVKQNIEEVIFKYVGQLHKGNSELLSEMNDMNQVLKERGETISKLEQLSQKQRKELEEALTKILIQSNKLSEKNKKLEEMEGEFGKVKVEMEKKNRVMQEMEEEIWRMKNNDSQGEALSSSTISRADDAAHFMDLEESFEERYSKLKVIAVKLKKKVSDLQNQVETEKSNVIVTEIDYQNKIKDFQIQVKSLRNIQFENDRLQDILDAEKKEKNILKKNFELAQEEITLCKQQLEEEKSERNKLKVDRNSFEKIKKELTAHITDLKQVIEKQKKEINDIKRQLELRDRSIEEEKEKHKAAISLLEEQKLDSKKNNVLELEMAAYEKTAEDLKKKLDYKEKQVKELENSLEAERKTIARYSEEIDGLKLLVSKEQLKVEGFNCQLKQLNDELNTQRFEVQKKTELVKGMEKTLAEETVRVEGLSRSIEEITKEKFASEEKFRSNEEKLCKQIHSLEEKISSLEDILSREGMELEELKKEYQAYKVRAHNVLRQSQEKMTPSKQQNAIEELEQLKSASDSLKSRLDESTTTLQKLFEENGTLQEEKKRLFDRVHELNLIVADLRGETHRLKDIKQKENQEHNEALRMQKLQSETLAQCYQREIEDLKTKHNAEIEELKKELEQMQNSSMKFWKGDLKQTDFTGKRKIAGGFMPVKPEKETLDVMLLEREECEGSESVDSISPQTSNNLGLIPLEQLLTQSELPDGRKSQQDMAQIQGRLEKCQNRIRHLTVLLADAESDSARLTQLTDVLKEEIKRLQRSLDREKHAQNFEYLKNVIVKFVSLQNVDEKLRLVPVLNTILKLSPEEEATLVNCTKGIHEIGPRSWGLNLSLWPTG